MAYRDLRDFMDKLELEGELVRVKAEVDPVFEIGAICREVLDARGPALLFERVKGQPLRLTTDLMATRRRYAMAIDTTPDRVHEEWQCRLTNPLPPIRVSFGPCKERILIGADIDLTRLTSPVWNEFDGGPFITLGCYVSRDPETGTGNMAIYRTQIHDRNTIGIQANPYRHVMQQARKAWARGEPFPVAVVIGADPAVSICAAGDFPLGTDELAMAGGLRNEPVEVVPCETIPVDVPANSEIVLECEMVEGERRVEGPFGEVSGYYGEATSRQSIRVKAITMRRDAIHQGSYEGRPPQETAVMVGVQIESEMLRTCPLPGLKAVHVPEGASGEFMAIASIEKRFEGYGKMVGLALLGTWPSRMVKWLIVVDDDVDPFDWNQVQWALSTRVQPHRDIEVIRETVGHGLDPSIPEHERLKGTARTSKIIIDATAYDAAHYDKVCAPHPDAIAKVRREWDRYGIPLSIGQTVGGLLARP